MGLIPAKTPRFVRTVFPNFVWSINTNEKVLYLTFDDGPTPGVTEWVLEELDKFDAKATFFCIGQNIENHPETFYTVIEKGHAIGNHTHKHLNGWKHKTITYVKDIEKAQNIIKSNASAETSLFRPPYGKIKPKQAKQLQALGYTIIMWDVLSFDWDASVSRENCLKNVKNSAKEGSIIVCHDSVKAFQNLKYTLPKTLEYFSNLGFQFKSI